MTIKINGVTFLINRKKEHKNYLWSEIYRLRQEIVDDVLEGHSRNRIPIKALKRKATLIKKYSRRLKLLET